MSLTPALERDAALVLDAFRTIHEQVFADDPSVNAALEVEVIPVTSLDGAFGEQSVLILITPWALNGVIIPGRGLPESMDVTGQQRAVIAMETDALGAYAQVTLVGDVSRYGSQEQARTIANSMVPVLMAGLLPPEA